jgi:hypothetical protein
MKDDLLHRAIALLKAHEWSGSSWGEGGKCPRCLEDRRDSHREDCEWGAVLEEVEAHNEPSWLKALR